MNTKQIQVERERLHMRSNRLGGREKETQQENKGKKEKKKEQIKSQDLKLARVRWLHQGLELQAL